jgi:antibiotic biosynthesis monooxygenase (ABM) superfamily enzyme
MNESGPAGATTIVTQTRVREGDAEGFAAFQAKISAAVAEQPGFIEQSVLPPNPPIQVDWVILQRFAQRDDAIAWLRSERRRSLLAEVQPILSGLDDIHLVGNEKVGVLPSPVSAVIATRVKPGQEAEYRRWEHRLAAVQARFPGFQGYRLEPPIPGVQDSYVALLRFASEATLQAWMNSAERQTLLQEAERLTEDVHARIVRSGFSQWFASEAQVPRWKQNMVVLLLLYPVVFLFGLSVQAPFLRGVLGLPFWLTLFLSNIASITVLNYLVPWTSGRLGWWLNASLGHRRRTDTVGAALLVLLYITFMAIFSFV